MATLGGVGASLHSSLAYPATFTGGEGDTPALTTARMVRGGGSIAKGGRNGRKAQRRSVLTADAFFLASALDRVPVEGDLFTITDPDGVWSGVYKVTDGGAVPTASGEYRVPCRRESLLATISPAVGGPRPGIATITPPTPGTVPSAGPASDFTRPNVDVVAISIGAPVAINATGMVLAHAASVGTACGGFALQAAAVGFAATVATDTHAELADWSAIAGTATLLPGSVYYLSPTAGRITTTRPTSGILQRVGIAATATRLDIEIAAPVRL